MLIVLQGMDTSGKDGTVSRLLIERMEEMKLTCSKPDLDVRALKRQIKAAA